MTTAASGASSPVPPSGARPLPPPGRAKTSRMSGADATLSSKMKKEPQQATANNVAAVVSKTVAGNAAPPPLKKEPSSLIRERMKNFQKEAPPVTPSQKEAAKIAKMVAPQLKKEASHTEALAKRLAQSSFPKPPLEAEGTRVPTPVVPPSPKAAKPAITGGVQEPLPKHLHPQDQAIRRYSYTPTLLEKFIVVGKENPHLKLKEDRSAAKNLLVAASQDTGAFLTNHEISNDTLEQFSLFHESLKSRNFERAFSLLAALEPSERKLLLAGISEERLLIFAGSLLEADSPTMAVLHFLREGLDMKHFPAKFVEEHTDAVYDDKSIAKLMHLLDEGNINGAASFLEGLKKSYPTEATLQFILQAEAHNPKIVDAILRLQGKR